MLLISIRPDLYDFPGSLYESELTGKLRAHWSIRYSNKAAILAHMVYHHSGDRVLVPREKECPSQRECVQGLLKLGLCLATQT